MRRATGAAAALCLLASCGEAPQPPAIAPGDGAPAASGPDVVLVLVDTLRADALSCYGQALPLTPHMDRLSRRGRLDEQVQAPSPWTKPTLASLFTGLLPHQHGVLKGLHSDERGGNRVDRLPEGMATLAGRLREGGYRTVALQANPNASAAQGFDRGFDDYRERFWASGRGLVREGVPILKEPRTPPSGGRRPLFLFTHMLDPHTPYVPRPYPFDDLPPPCMIALPDVRQDDGLPRQAPDLARDATRAYHSEVLDVDAAVGALVLAAGERRDLSFVVLSDHGEELGDHGGYEHGHTLYQELLHVPRIVTGPGIAPSLAPAPVALQDVHHELLARTIRVPAPPPSPLLSEGMLYGPPRIALREGEAKLVADPASARPIAEFDLAGDPGEIAPHDGHDPELALRLVRTALAGVAPPAPTAEVDPATEAALKSLGYTARDPSKEQQPPAVDAGEDVEPPAP